MRVNNFIKRLRIAVKFLFYGSSGARIMTCGKCGSINISPVVDTDIDEEIHSILKEQNVKRVWREVSVCHHCGAQVVEKQYWVWD